MQKLNKTAEIVMTTGGFIIAMFILVAIGGGTWYVTKNGFALPELSVGGDNAIICDSTTTPELDLNAYDANSKGTALTESVNIYREKGDVSWKAFTQGTAFGVTAGKMYEGVFGISTSDFTDNAYGPAFETKSIECLESVGGDVALFQDEVETSLSATFYDENHDASAQSLSANQEKNVYLKFETGSDEVCGNPYLAGLPDGISLPDEITIVTLSDNGNHRTKYPNVICLNLNSTTMDTPDGVSFEGVSMNKVSTPTRHTVASTESAYCYEMPVIDDASVELKIRVNTDDSNAPAVDDSASVYCGNYFIHSEEGDLHWGVEDDQGNAVGTDAADTVALQW